MVKTSIEKLAGEIGFDIAQSDNLTQANLLNGFCKGLANSMDERSLERQLCYIVEELNTETSKVLKRLVKFLDLKES